MATQGGRDWFDGQYSRISNETAPRPQPQPREPTWQNQLDQESFGQPPPPFGQPPPFEQPLSQANAPMQERDIPMGSPQPTDHENTTTVRFQIRYHVYLRLIHCPGY